MQGVNVELDCRLVFFAGTGLYHSPSLPTESVFKTLFFLRRLLLLRMLSS